MPVGEKWAPPLLALIVLIFLALCHGPQNLSPQNTSEDNPVHSGFVHMTP